MHVFVFILCLQADELFPFYSFSFSTFDDCEIVEDAQHKKKKATRNIGTFRGDNKNNKLASSN